MDYKELKEAVERYRSGDFAYNERISDAFVIADALTDPAPIDADVLKGMGFEEREGKYILGIGLGKLKASPSSASTLIFGYMPENCRAFDHLNPQPRTVGALYALMLSLEQGTGT